MNEFLSSLCHLKAERMEFSVEMNLKSQNMETNLADLHFLCWPIIRLQ